MSLEPNEVISRMTVLPGRRPLAEAGHWETVDEWDSFKARFVHLRSASGEEAALKLGTNWSAADAGYVGQEVNRVRSILGALPGGEVLMPEALGWASDPPAVLLEFTRGTNLFAWLSRTGPNGGASRQAMVDVVALCGQAIGAYHSSEPADSAHDDDPQAALDDLLSTARRAGVSRRVILSIEPDLARARGYRFSANDFTIDSVGRLVMHDPPHVRKFDYLHRDVSGFTYDLHRGLLGNRPFDSGHPWAAMTAELREAFVSGYAVTGLSTLGDPLDDWLVRLFEYGRILGRARGLIRRRQFTELPNQMRWAWQVRRGLGSLS